MKVISDLTGKEPPEKTPCKCHSACDCREGMFSKCMKTQRRVIAVLACSDNNLRSEFPDITDGEIVMIRKVLTSICGGKS
jgi:hypothetical protein